MRSYNRILSVAGSLLSLKKHLHRKGGRRIARQLLSMICVMTLLLSMTPLSVMAATGPDGLRNQSIELNLAT